MLSVSENTVTARLEGFAAFRPVVGTESGVHTPTPSEQMYGPLLVAFNHFNSELFGGELPGCLVTIRAEGKTKGFYHAKTFAALGGEAVTDEIAMNPAYFSTHPLKDTASTFTHELVHHWQAHHGTPPRGGYHNRQWGMKMRSLGLIPSSTGAVGGKETGYRMDHYVVEGGPFDLSYARLETAGWQIGWGDAATSAGGNEVGSSKPKRARFVCLGCDLKMYGPPKAKVLCVPCGRPLIVSAAANIWNATSAPLPMWIEKALESEPVNSDRPGFARFHTRVIGPISPRTLEDWPLTWQRVNGKAITNTRAAITLAWRRFQDAPPYRVTRKKKTAATSADIDP
jgi:hypothetical protein